MFSSCAVEGDEISGLWFSNGLNGKMKIEIKPSNGTFEGYLVEYEENGQLVSGGNDKSDLIFKGLRFKNDKYLGGSFLKSHKENNTCGFKLAFDTEGKQALRAGYLCSGENRLEYWYRDKYHDKPVMNNNIKSVSLDQLLKANPNNKDK